MDALISLLVYLIIFAVIGYGLWWACVKFQMPPPVFWLVGGILLIVLLVFLSKQVNLGPILTR